MACRFAGETAMNLRALAVVGLAALGACTSSGEEAREARPIEKVFAEDERSPAKSAGWCSKCNFEVYQGHRCGLTVPCALCKREAGARHLHEVQWTCARHELVMSSQHECLDARTCTTCRADKRSLLGTRACERCYAQVPPTRIHGITSYCGDCNLEVGANHLHGKTVYCRSCLRESGAGHKCDATRLCMEHEIEHAPDHVHGTTQYCGRCHREAGVDHKHGLTEWCWRCNVEVDWPHHYH